MTEVAPDQLPESWNRIACTYERAFEKLTARFRESWCGWWICNCSTVCLP